ncbi:MAG: MBL fold metallo-hydrolase [Chromatiales bacterium]|nr:MBL fold metallo-hydrolase [Chromatiales bacterium]MDH3894044.1 MBL fold metallo-hydrolase [Chromatiales bacterium]MDH4014664.1 MBL fold metallo-hydrolase [Chromatiales bacterium]
MQLQILGAAGEVTGSCYLIESGGRRVLLECGLKQGSRSDEQANRADFPFDPKSIDAVVLSHAHIDHSGRLPLLVQRGYRGPIYCHRATRDLCRVMLRDAAFLNEKEAGWENRKRERKGLDLVEPLYSMADAERSLEFFRGLAYERRQSICPGVEIRLLDAGHILGSAIVEIWLDEGGQQRKVVFSGDLGHYGAPILRDPTPVKEADLVLMESTYGNRQHRGWAETIDEFAEIFRACAAARGNILVPAFAVGRSQELLYLMNRHHRDWGLERWRVFLDSPMAIQATSVYRKYGSLYDREARDLWRNSARRKLLPNLHYTRTTQQSMSLNSIRSGAIIVASSGMCTGGRIKHHLKNNVWRKECHIVVTGFMAAGTPGRALVDGARSIRLWGETIRVGATVHTIGGLSAHADQAGLCKWYEGFDGRPPLLLVHGEPRAAAALQELLANRNDADVSVAEPHQVIDLIASTGNELRH